MDNKVSLPDDQWLLFRDSEEVTNRQRRPFMRVIARMRQGEDTSQDADYMLSWSIAVTYMLLAGWSWDEPLPKDFDEFSTLFEDLPGWRYDLVTVASVDFMNRNIDAEATPDEEVEEVELPKVESDETPTKS